MNDTITISKAELQKLIDDAVEKAINPSNRSFKDGTTAKMLFDVPCTGCSVIGGMVLAAGEDGISPEMLDHVMSNVCYPAFADDYPSSKPMVNMERIGFIVREKGIFRPNYKGLLAKTMSELIAKDVKEVCRKAITL